MKKSKIGIILEIVIFFMKIVDSYFKIESYV